MITLDLNSEIEQELKERADGQGKPVAQLLKDLVLNYLEESKTIDFEDEKKSELKAFFTNYQKDISGFKFDREEANAR